MPSRKHRPGLRGFDVSGTIEGHFAGPIDGLWPWNSGAWTQKRASVQLVVLAWVFSLPEFMSFKLFGKTISVVNIYLDFLGHPLSKRVLRQTKKNQASNKDKPIQSRTHSMDLHVSLPLLSPVWSSVGLP